MPTCGNCYLQGQTVEHIRACHMATHEAVLLMEIELSPLVVEYVRYRSAA